MTIYRLKGHGGRYGFTLAKLTDIERSRAAAAEMEAQKKRQLPDWAKAVLAHKPRVKYTVKAPWES